jgi:hypothetical protein
MHFSTRHKVSSNRSNAKTWMARPSAAKQDAKRRGTEQHGGRRSTPSRTGNVLNVTQLLSC